MSKREDAGKFRLECRVCGSSSIVNRPSEAEDFMVEHANH